jgi:hypothetical protein
VRAAKSGGGKRAAAKKGDLNAMVVVYEKNALTGVFALIDRTEAAAAQQHSPEWRRHIRVEHDDDAPKRILKFAVYSCDTKNRQESIHERNLIGSAIVSFDNQMATPLTLPLLDASRNPVDKATITGRWCYKVFLSRSFGFYSVLFFM